MTDLQTLALTQAEARKIASDRAEFASAGAAVAWRLLASGGFAIGGYSVAAFAVAAADARRASSAAACEAVATIGYRAAADSLPPASGDLRRIASQAAEAATATRN